MHSHPGVDLRRFRDGGGHVEARASGPFVADDGESLAAYAPGPAQTPLHAVYAPGPYVAPKVRTFADFLVDRFSVPHVWRDPATA